MKRCTKCAEVKARESFCKQRRDGRVTLRSACKSCINKRRRTLYSPVKSKRVYEKRRLSCPNDRVVAAAAHRRNKYGMTLEQWDEMMLNQGGMCAMCNEERRLGVDHNHATGKVRALLCLGCNVAIGHLKESADLATNAASYLKKHL